MKWINENRSLFQRGYEQTQSQPKDFADAPHDAERGAQGCV
jgi:hypothetical protein